MILDWLFWFIHLFIRYRIKVTPISEGGLNDILIREKDETRYTSY